MSGGSEENRQQIAREKQYFERELNHIEKINANLGIVNKYRGHD